jgi:hypothetical protein
MMNTPHSADLPGIAEEPRNSESLGERSFEKFLCLRAQVPGRSGVSTLSQQQGLCVHRSTRRKVPEAARSCCCTRSPHRNHHHSSSA